MRISANYQQGMNKLMVLDGDFESELRRHLKPTEQEDKAFALHALKFNRFAVYKTHLAHLRAGAQIIRTNTYQATLLSSCHRLDNSSDYVLMIKEAVVLAQKAVFKYYEEMGGDTSDVLQYHERRPLIAGTCSSCSASNFGNSFKVPVEKLSLAFLSRFYKERLDSLWSAKIDMFAFESIPSWKETRAIIKTLTKFPTARSWITFSCTQDGLLLDGTDFITAAVSCYEALPQFVAIGAECESSEAIKCLMKRFNEINDRKIPFVFFAKKSYLQTTEDTDKCSAGQQRNLIQELLDIGVRYIGGGTGTVAEDIKEIYKQVDNYRMSSNDNFTVLTTCCYQNDNNQSKL